MPPTRPCAPAGDARCTGRRSCCPAHWIADSGLAGDAPAGLVDIDPETLQHRRYPSIWAIGDAAALGTRSSGGALRHQVQVLAHNLAAAQDGRKPMRRYDGYTVVPITVSRRRLLLVEVDRDGRPAPSVPLIGLARPRRATWLLDRYALPVLYWRRLLRGKVRSSPAVIRADALTRTLSARPAGPRPRTRPLPGRRLIR